MELEARVLTLEKALKATQDIVTTHEATITKHEATITKLSGTAGAPVSSVAKTEKKEPPKLSGTEFTVSWENDAEGKKIAKVTKTGQFLVPSVRYGANTYLETEAIEKNDKGGYVNNELLVHLMRDSFYKGKSAIVKEVFKA